MSSASRRSRQAGERATTPRAIEPETEAAPPLGGERALALRDKPGTQQRLRQVGRDYRASFPSSTFDAGPIVPFRCSNSRIATATVFELRPVGTRRAPASCLCIASTPSSRVAPSAVCPERACDAYMRRRPDTRKAAASKLARFAPRDCSDSSIAIARDVLAAVPTRPCSGGPASRVRLIAGAAGRAGQAGVAWVIRGQR
jgi:hypothetical protein